MGKKVKIVLDMHAHFEEKFNFFGINVDKWPCIIIAIWGKMNFLGIFGEKHYGLLGKKVKIVLDMQAWNLLTHLAHTGGETRYSYLNHLQLGYLARYIKNTLRLDRIQIMYVKFTLRK